MAASRPSPPFLSGLSPSPGLDRNRGGGPLAANTVVERPYFFFLNRSGLNLAGVALDREKKTLSAVYGTAQSPTSLRPTHPRPQPLWVWGLGGQRLNCQTITIVNTFFYVTLVNSFSVWIYEARGVGIYHVSWNVCPCQWLISVFWLITKQMEIEDCGFLMSKSRHEIQLSSL